MMKRLLIAGTHSGAGKTTIATGLMAAFASAKMRVQPFKIGPDYIDTAFHAAAAGRISRNLDLWMLGPETLAALFAKSARQADISVIEGVMGLYDGSGPGNLYSTAEVAKQLGCPVILVVDVRGMSGSAAAQVLGYREMDRQVRLAGVILNNVRTDRQAAAITAAIDEAAGVPVVGWLPADEAVRLPSRHLGLVPAGETSELRTIMSKLAAMIAAHIDMEKLMKIAEDTEPLHGLPQETINGGSRVRLAVARDAAFNFYYADSLDTLAAAGFELVPFSPLQDARLPESVGGLYLGGGFPEIFAETLAENQSMRQSVREALQTGMPCFAECGGFAYLCRQLIGLDGVAREMAGWYDHDIVMTGKLQRFGYVEVQLQNECVLGKPNMSFHGHEFHYSATLENPPEPIYRVKRVSDHSEWDCGFARGQAIAGYPHIHFAGCPDIARHFAARCGQYYGGDIPDAG